MTILTNVLSDEEKAAHPDYMLEATFKALENPTLYHARAFLYHQVGANRFYLNEADQTHEKALLIDNKKLGEFSSVVVVDLELNVE